MRRALPLLPLLVPVVVYAAVLVRGYDGGTYLRGDCPYYLYATQSLARDRDLDLSNQIPGGLSRHFDQVSLGKDGRVVPKHPIVMPLAAVPLVSLLGPVGALVFNVAQCVGLLIVLYVASREAASPWAAASAVAATGTLSFLPHYVWNFSPDLFATLAVTSAFLVLARDSDRHWRNVLGGTLLGIACVAKPALVVLIPAALVLALRPWQRLAWAVGGLALPMAAWALLNVHLFGAPYVTAYDRIARLGDHGVETYSQRDDFNQPVWKGLKRQMRHPTQGLLQTSAITLVSWIGLPWLAWRRPRVGAGIAIGTAALVLLFSAYQLWDSSHYGNRHLLPAVALAVVPLAALLDAAGALVRRRPFRVD